MAYSEALVTMAQEGYQTVIAFLKDLPTAIALIIGTTTGFLLNQWATTSRDRNAAKKQAIAVRKLLHLEINANLDLLRTFLEEVETFFSMQQIADDSEEWDKWLRSLDPRFLTLPTWHDKAFESQLPLLTVVLNEAELLKVFRFYSMLNIDIPARIGNLRNIKFHAEMDIFSTVSNKDMLLRQWQKLEEFIEEELKQGNPLKTPKSETP